MRRFSLILATLGGLAVTGCQQSTEPDTSKPGRVLRDGRAFEWSATTHADGSAPRGKLLFQRYCTACHGPMPTEAPPPNEAIPMPMPAGPPGSAEIKVKYEGKIPPALEDRTDLDAATIEAIVRQGMGVMPPLRKTELGDKDLHDLALYISRGR